MQAKSATPRRGQESDPVQAYAVIASRTTPASAMPLREPLHLARGRGIGVAGGL